MKKTLGILAITIFSLLLFQNCQKSDFVVLTGVVRDSVTNQPIEGAYVVSENGIAVSASDGTFTIDGIRQGKSNVSVHGFNGYLVSTQSGIINEGQINKLDFRLSKMDQPEIRTGRIKTILTDKAIITGALKLKSNLYVSSYGHCWSVISTPTLENAINKTDLGGTYSARDFTSTLTGLQAEQLYYVRAYAITSAGTIYGNTVVLKTSDLSINAGMLAFMPFNGEFSDESGSDNSVWGWSQLLTTDRFNIPDRATAFDGNSFVYSYSYSGLYKTFNDFSVSFWFYKTSWQTNTAMVCAGYPYYDNEFRIGEENAPNRIFFDIITKSGIKYKVSASSLPELNKWHNIVAVRENSTIKLYIDGILQNTAVCDSQPIDYTTAWGSTYLFLGSDLWTTSYFRGNLDDVRLYDRALTDTEINDLLTH